MTQKQMTVGGAVRFGLAGLLAAVMVATGCAPRMKMLTEKRYPERSPLQQIELYQGDVDTPHEDIAIIDSVAVDGLTTDTRKQMVEDLRERARRLGGDAVTNVTLLIVPERGWVVDPQTPFHSWRQGWRELNILRGRAVRFRPLLIETDGAAKPGEQFNFGPGEQPTVKPGSKTDLEIYATTDASGRNGWASRPAQPPKPRLPTVERGN